MSLMLSQRLTLTDVNHGSLVTVFKSSLVAAASKLRLR